MEINVTETLVDDASKHFFRGAPIQITSTARSTTLPSEHLQDIMNTSQWGNRTVELLVFVCSAFAHKETKLMKNEKIRCIGVFIV